MLSVREIQERTVGYLAEKGISNPKLETDLLIAHVLGLKRLELYLDINRPLTEAQLDSLRPLVKRRAGREPLQYILGSTEFCGLELKVDRRALIPRPETEELIEHIHERIDSTPRRILDLGTGSGAIAIALAKAYPEAEVWATDQSEKALALAKENAEIHIPDERIQFLQGSWWEAVPEDEAFDLIASNPPYLTEAELQSAEPEVINNEPNDALASGPDGLDDLKQIIMRAKQHLAPGGLVALETGIDQHGKLDTLCTDLGLKGKGLSDMSGRPRFYFITPVASAPEETSLADASIQEPIQEPKPPGTDRLRKGGSSQPETHHFITCYTENRGTGLETETCAIAILKTLEELHAETSIDLLSATIMPDHLHILMRLGRRLELSQVIGKFKTATQAALDENGLVWQGNDYVSRLRSDHAAEQFSKYIFLNPYLSGLISSNEVWPWWVLNENYRPEFLDVLEDPPLPPEAWLEKSPELQELLGQGS